ncbi:MAG: 50S ribosomal protein L18 [Acidobacteriota bacterium]
MARKLSRRARRVKIHGRIRKTIHGTRERPRLCVFRSLQHTYAQLVDDEKGNTLVSASTLEGKKVSPGSNIDAAKRVGQLIAQKAQEQGVSAVVFDRGGYIYAGRVKALAEAAREAGLKF